MAGLFINYIPIAKADDTQFPQICFFWNTALLALQGVTDSESEWGAEGSFTLLKYIGVKPILGNVT